MSNGKGIVSIISEIPVTRDYGTTVLRAAHHRQCVLREANAVVLADELGKRPDIEVMAIVDSERRPMGMLTRAYLFSLLGKPFGREVLAKTAVWELAEVVPLLDSHAGLFSADTEGAASYRILVDGEGRFLAVLAARDLARHLSRITEDDIELAGRIQERLEAGNEIVSGVGFIFEAWSRPARGVGGDFWYSKRLGDGSWFLALCDVSGKGVAASLVVALVSGMLRMYDFGKGLGTLVIALNEALVATFHLERYLTGFFCIFNPDTHVIQIADMGHSHAFVFREGRARRLKAAVANLP